uniref:Protein kinase domain-containing protein n=1 Tax=Petromyzon marinus TaxID=7757 RepID=S4RCG0_PETMA
PEPTLIPSLAVSPEDLTDISFIGSGGFGIVFKATHKRWCVQVALKCAKSTHAPSHEADLLKEAQKMKMAQFDFILPLRGYVHDFSFRHALVMPYMPCGSLHGLLQRCGQASGTRGDSSALPWPLRCRFVDQIAHGMNYLHGLKPHPLLHLDLKPQNVLLDDDYHVKICDFGLSKWREVTGSKWSDGESTKLFGTLPYVPPEYLRDTHRKPHHTFDVYSFAIVVWEILTLTTPYANAVNSFHVVECVVKGNQRPSTDDIPEDRPREADSLIRLMTSCWDCNPKARPSFYDCIKVTEPVFNAFKD